MYTLNYKLVDGRNNRKCEIVAIDEIEGKLLYTVKYIDGQHKRYYADRLTNLFVASKDNIVMQETKPKPNPDQFKNICFIDMKSKTKFANYESWLQWVELTGKIG